MRNFGEIAEEHITEEFRRLTKAVEKLSPEERERYADRNPILIWLTVCGIDISVN